MKGIAKKKIIVYLIKTEPANYVKLLQL